MFIEAEFFTMDHVIRGFVDTPGERLSDFLNNKRAASIYLGDVQMAGLMTVGAEPPLVLTEASLTKQSILFAVPVEQDMTVKSLYRRTTRQIYRLSVTLPNFAVHGGIHLTEPLDINRVLITRPEDFIPLTDAKAVYVINPKLAIQASTIIFNKANVNLIGIRPLMELTNP